MKMQLIVNFLCYGVSESTGSCWSVRNWCAVGDKTKFTVLVKENCKKITVRYRNIRITVRNTCNRLSITVTVRTSTNGGGWAAVVRSVVRTRIVGGNNSSRSTKDSLLLTQVLLKESCCNSINSNRIIRHTAELVMVLSPIPDTSTTVPPILPGMVHRRQAVTTRRIWWVYWFLRVLTFGTKVPSMVITCYNEILRLP